MATVNIVGNVKTQTAAQWGADATVYTNQQILVTSDVQYTGTDQNKFKIADGFGAWSTLDYMSDTASLTKEGIVEIANQAEVNTGTDTLKPVTPDTLQNSTLVSTTVAANTAKVTNATHTSEVTGSTALTVDKTAISNKTLVTAVAGDHVLIGDASDTDNLKKVNVSDFLGGGLGCIWTFGNNYRFNPADGVNYYLVQWQNATGTETNANNAKSLAPVSMTVEAVTISSVSSAATTENVTFAIGVNAVYTNVTTTYQMLGTDAQTITGLNISIAQGDDIIIRMTCPTWATNPLSLRINFNIYGT